MDLYMDYETMVFTIIAHSGDSRSSSMEAIAYAKKGEFDKAEECLTAANQKLLLVHTEQTKLIQAEAQGQETKLSLLLIHAQDHLMNAVTIKDLAGEMVEMYRAIKTC